MRSTEINSQYRNHYIFHMKDIGCTRALRGHVTVSVFYVDQPGAVWDTDRRLAFQDAYDQAMRTLEKEAGNSGTSLHIRSVFQTFQTKCTNARSQAWLVDFFNTYGIKAIADYQRIMRQKTGCDEAPVVFAFTRSMTSYALCADTQHPFVDEYSVVDSYDTPWLIIHELLHQFGAEDLYLPPDTKKAAGKYLPDSVMQSGEIIDSLTRYLIGWTDEISEKAVAFLEATKHYTLQDALQARIDYAKSSTGTAKPTTSPSGKRVAKPTKTAKPVEIIKPATPTAITDLSNNKRVPYTPQDVVPFPDFASLETAANNGNAYALFLIAYCYRYGILTEKDKKKALAWYYRHKSLSDALAITTHSYAHGVLKQKEHTDTDPTIIESALLIAASAGHIWAMNDLGTELMKGRMLKRDIPHALRLLQTACEPGVSTLVLEEYYTACEYSKLLPQLHKAIGETAKRYEYSCLNGSVNAQFTMATLYQKGEYLPGDPRKAFELFSRAAKSDYYMAYFELAYCYEFGLGTPADSALARKYYTLGEERSKATGFPIDANFFKQILKCKN
ncbi:MAG: sel1 repeat family protein [Clostridia bacterium]|nr:sel1 repeat family protein [Clostridia bacterium]